MRRGATFGFPGRGRLRRQPALRAGRRSRPLAQETLEPRTPLAVSGSLVDGVLSIQCSAAKDLVSLISSETTYTVGGTGMQTTAFPKSSVTAIKIGDAGSVNLAGQTVLLGSSAGSIVDPITVTGIEATVLNASVYVSEGSGDVVFGGPVLLPTDKIRVVSNSVGNVRFQSTINGSGYLRLATDAVIELADKVGNVSPLRGLTFASADLVVGRSPIVIDGRWGSHAHDGLRIGRFVGGLLLDGAGSSVTRSSSGVRIEPNDADDSVGFFSGRTIRNFRISQNSSGVVFEIPGPLASPVIDEPVFRNWTLADNKITSNAVDGICFKADAQGRSVTSNITLSGNTISLNKKDGIRVNGTPEDLLIQKNTLTGNGTKLGDAAIRFTDGLGQPRLNVKVDGNSIGFLNPLAPNIVSVSAGISARNLPGLRLTGNTLTNMTVGVSLAGDFTRADLSPVLAANTFTRNATGIDLAAATNVAIDATNAVNTSRAVGLLASGNCAGSSVTGVVFQNAKGGTTSPMSTGVSLKNTSGITLSGIRVTSGHVGIRLEAAQNVSIAGAAVSGVVMHAIRAAGDCQGLTISAPTLSDNGDGIRLTGARGVKIQDGTIVGTANATGIDLSGDCAGTTVSGMSLNELGLGVSLQGAQGVTISDVDIRLGGAGLVASGTCAGSKVTGMSVSDGTLSGATLSAVQGLRIENSSFEKNRGGGLDAYGNCAGTVVTGTAFDDNQHPLVENALTVGIRLGVGGLEGAQGLTITDCTASGNEHAGLVVRGNSAGTTISGCTFDNNGTDGMNVSATGLTLAAGNSAAGNLRWGLWATGTCTGTKLIGSSFSGNTDGVQLLSATGIALSGLTVNGNGTFGLFVSGSVAGVTVSTSTFSGNQTGILLAHAQGLAIKAGNTVQGNALGLAAYGDCAGTTVVGTAIKNNTDTGVVLTAATKLTINGLNKIQGNGDGVSVTGLCTGTLVNGNLISGNVKAGLLLEDTQSFQAKNNTVTNNQTFGLRALGVSTGTTVTGNTIINNKTNISVTATGGTFQKA